MTFSFRILITPPFTSVTVRGNFPEKYKLSTTFRYWVNERHVTDRQTDRLYCVHVEYVDDQFGLGWFDVNRSIFGEDMREERFLHFRSQWPWRLTFRLQICSPNYSCPALCQHEIRSFYGFPTSRKSEARDARTDGWTDGVEHLMRSPREDRIIRS